LSPKRDGGAWAIEIENFATRTAYLPNTAILHHDPARSQRRGVEITDFAPRWRHYNRLYRPVGLFRACAPLRRAAHPRALQPLAEWGAREPGTHLGQQPHALAVAGPRAAPDDDLSLRLLREELPFVLDRELHFVLGPTKR
jgi:hypothetical protein